MMWLYVCLFACIIEEALSLIHAAANWRYALKGLRQTRPPRYTPKALLIVPCKGLDAGFRANIKSFLHQDYPDYVLWFVVGDQADPAYTHLRAILASIADASRASSVSVLVAGPCTTSSQKLHNLLYAIARVPSDIEVLAFADSDIEAPTYWLSSLVEPLVNPRVGATTGYRWFVPTRTNLASLAVSCLNAKVAQMLGQSSFNLAWGGSMAIRTQTFRQCNVEQIWSRSLADDLTLANTVKSMGLTIKFVPKCLVLSYCQMGWRQLLEFGRRQFFLTRLYSPGTWLVAMIGTALAILDLWLVLGLAVWSGYWGWKLDLEGWTLPAWPVWLGAWVLFMGSGLVKAIMRQQIGLRLLVQPPWAVKKAMLADLLGFWVWPVVMLVLILSAALGRTIDWRGLRYRVYGPGRVEVFASSQDTTGG